MGEPGRVQSHLQYLNQIVVPVPFASTVGYVAVSKNERKNYQHIPPRPVACSWTTPVNSKECLVVFRLPAYLFFQRDYKPVWRTFHYRSKEISMNQLSIFNNCLRELVYTAADIVISSVTTRSDNELVSSNMLLFNRPKHISLNGIHKHWLFCPWRVESRSFFPINWVHWATLSFQKS